MTARFLAAAAVGMLVGCGGAHAPEVSPLSEVAAVRDTTTPAGTTLSDVDGPRRLGETLRAAWTIPLRRPWTEYAAGVEQRLAALGYERRGAEDGLTRSFSRHAPGDVFAVRLDASRDPSQVRVQFTAMPD